MSLSVFYYMRFSLSLSQFQTMSSVLFSAIQGRCFKGVSLVGMLL